MQLIQKKILRFWNIKFREFGPFEKVVKLWVQKQGSFFLFMRSPSITIIIYINLIRMFQFLFFEWFQITRMNVIRKKRTHSQNWQSPTKWFFSRIFWQMTEKHELNL